MTSCGIYIFKGSEVDPRETWVMLHESAIYDSSEKNAYNGLWDLNLAKI